MELEFPQLLAVLDKQPNFIQTKFGSASLGENLNPGSDLFVDGTRDPALLGSRHFNESGYALFAQRIADRLLSDKRFVSSSVSLPLRLNFGDSVTRRWMRSGWYQDESTHVWSEGLQSVLKILLPTSRDIKMDFECHPFQYPDNPQQRVSIVLNGTVIEEIPLRSNQHQYSVILPKKALLASLNTVELRYAYARQPQKVLPDSKDNRLLAVAWYSIDFVELD